jgi:kynurenine formamidase
VAIEYLTTLDLIGAPRCQFVRLALVFAEGDGSPIRAIADAE